MNDFRIQRQVHQQLMAPLLGEKVDDAVERLVGAVGMQRCETQMARLGELYAVFHRFLVADLADQDDVRRLAQRVLECGMPGLRVDADFALRDDASLMRVDILDRILDRHDVAARVFVAMTDHGGERRRLTRARAADNDAQAALVHDDVLENRRQLEFLERRNFGRDRTEHGTHHALLNECAHPEAADALRRDREITSLWWRRTP